MVLCNNLSPTEALKNFSDARGHTIERQNYIDGIESHGSNEMLKLRIETAKALTKKHKTAAKPEQERPAVQNKPGTSRKFSTHAAASHNAPPHRNEAANGYNWRSQRHDYSRDRSIPDDNRFSSNPRDNSQVGRGGPHRRGGQAHSHNYEPYPRNSSSRSKSRESMRGAANSGQQGRTGRGQASSSRFGGQYQSYSTWRNRAVAADSAVPEESQPPSGHPVNEGWNKWVAKRMSR